MIVVVAYDEISLPQTNNWAKVGAIIEGNVGENVYLLTEDIPSCPIDLILYDLDYDHLLRKSWAERNSVSWMDFIDQNKDKLINLSEFLDLIEGQEVIREAVESSDLVYPGQSDRYDDDNTDEKGNEI